MYLRDDVLKSSYVGFPGKLAIRVFLTKVVMKKIIGVTFPLLHLKSLFLDWNEYIEVGINHNWVAQ